jgi:tetratricopeptide (TPR) repeat protein
MMRWTRIVGCAGLCLWVGAVTGCAASNGGVGGDALASAKASYQAGQYEQAYRLAVSRTQGDGRTAAQAAYLAGMSAQKLRRVDDAERYLRQASQGTDAGVAGDAMVALGLLYAEHGRHAQAAATFLAVAPRLTGDGRAQAYLHAALSQQKLGQFAQARTNLSLAMGATQNPALRARISDVMAVTGYTLQVGAFGDQARALAAAQAIAPRAVQLNLGQPVLAPRTDATGRTLTAVQLGSFATFDAANRAKAQLGDASAVIVPLSR